MANSSASPETAALGVMAYNEERNIARFLESLLTQTASSRISKIVVVASGCTDRTCEIVDSFCREDPRMTLVEEGTRSGKVSAINRFLFQAREEILIVSSADLVLEPETIEHMLAPFDDPEVGMVGAHPIPVDDPGTFFGYAANLMWALHHQVALRDPKMGELIAFRNVFRRLNPNNLIDELSVHQLIRSAGYKLVYSPEARIHNKGPDNLHDFVSQRVHCIVGNFQLMREHNVPAPTMRMLPVVRAAVPYALRHWTKLHWTVATAAIEFYCRLRSAALVRSKRARQRYKVWEQVSSTKALSPNLGDKA
jgi:biofilm PGA synthesis N-glycosyltransferase PgaC